VHVFLTGEKQIGKTRALNRAVELINLPCYGFRTRFLTRERGSSSLYMLPAEDLTLTDEAHMVGLLSEGRMHPLRERFDTLGVDLLREARRHPEGLILMDECGHLEKEALLFQREILACLDGDIPVLGVLRKGQAWHDFIRSHPRVCVLTVDEENRGGMAEQVVSLLRKGF